MVRAKGEKLVLIQKSEFIKLFADYNINITDEQFEKFSTYSDYLVEYNKVCNLTAILDPEGITIKHFLDSLLPFINLKIFENASIIDVGTGAGFPSVPLKIMNSSLDITLLDSLNKRITFLNSLCEKLELEKITAVHGRAEEKGREEQYREKFDFATARAVASLPELCEYCLPFVKIGGSFVALKGAAGEKELTLSQKAVKTLGGKIAQCKLYTLPSGDKRTLIVIKKISQTPPKYPRNKGQMTKKPL